MLSLLKLCYLSRRKSKRRKGCRFLKKILPISFLALLLTACGGQGTTGSTAEEPNAVKEDTSSEETVETEEVQGVFVGEIDNYTIEIKTDAEGAQAYYVPEEHQETVASLSEGDKLKVEYFKNNDERLEIKHIQVTE